MVRTLLQRTVRRAKTPRRGKSFRPYRAADSAATWQDVFADCNRAMFHGYSPAPGSLSAEVPLAYPIFYYEQLLKAFAEMPHLEVVTLAELCRKPAGNDTVRLAIRHDIDGDIVAALESARLEHEYGLPASHYVLHTAPYYGTFRSGVFHRNVCMAHVYREIQGLGHEVGLHTDGLTVYQRYGIDGGEAVAAEIEWLRREGIEVIGTVAHGSAAVFGAENYEIFQGRAKRAKDPCESGAMLEHNGTLARLRVLDERELGLQYEGNDIFRQKEAAVEYGATREVDGWRWNAHLKRVRRETGDPKRFEWCCQEELLEDIARTVPGQCVVLTIHPCYYGARHRPDSAPPRRRRTVQTGVNDKLGWTTYEPYAIQCWSDEDERPQSHQSVNVANRYGMLDQAAFAERRGTGPCVLLLGGEFLDGREVAGPSQVQSLLRRRMDHSTDGDKAHIVKLAFPKMGISRLWAWYRRLARRLQPDAVILGITSQELRNSVPGVWHLETGFSRTHPPGDYLDWRDGRLVEVPQSRGWEIRQRKPCSLEHWPGTEIPLSQMMGIDGPCRLDGMDCRQYLRECYRHIAGAIRAAGAQPLLMITEGGERAGWFDADRPEQSRDTARQHFQSHVHDIAESAGLPLIDPYPHFDEAADCTPVHFPDGAWTLTAHRLAAECLHDALKDNGIVAV